MSANSVAIPRDTPTAEMNSDTTTSAPKRRHSSRNGDSDTPAIGARKSGTSHATRYGNCLRVAFGRKLDGIDFKAIDDRPVHYFFLIVAPPLEVSNQYLPVLGKIAQFAKEPDVPDRLAKLATPQQFLKLLEEKNI